MNNTNQQTRVNMLLQKVQNLEYKLKIKTKENIQLENKIQLLKNENERKQFQLYEHQVAIEKSISTGCNIQ